MTEQTVQIIITLKVKENDQASNVILHPKNFETREKEKQKVALR